MPKKKNSNLVSMILDQIFLKSFLCSNLKKKKENLLEEKDRNQVVASFEYWIREFFQNNSPIFIDLEHLVLKRIYFIIRTLGTFNFFLQYESSGQLDFLQ